LSPQSTNRGRPPRQELVSSGAEPTAPAEGVADLGVIGTSAPSAGPAGLRPGQVWQRLRTAKFSLLVTVLVVVAGVAVAVGVTDRWQAQRQRDADESKVSLVILANPTGSTLVNDAVGRVDLLERLYVINTGPLAVEVSALHGARDAWTFQGPSTPQPVRPGVAQLVEVKIAVDCARIMPQQPVAVELTVHTMNGQTHQGTYLVSFAGSPSANLVDHVCSPERSRTVVNDTGVPGPR
jgi:hypothetical protein